jgi:hypothetical protein
LSMEQRNEILHGLGLHGERTRDTGSMRWSFEAWDKFSIGVYGDSTNSFMDDVRIVHAPANDGPFKNWAITQISRATNEIRARAWELLAAIGEKP